MSRAIWMSVAIVAGVSAFVSTAQASVAWATKPPPTTSAAPAFTPDASNWRRVISRKLAVSVMGPFPPWITGGCSPVSCPPPGRPPGRLLVAPGPLKHLDLVAVRVGDEEELGDDRRALAAGRELDDLAGREAGLGEAGVLGLEVVDREGEMAIAVAEVVGLGLALVDGQL